MTLNAPYGKEKLSIVKFRRKEIRIVEKSDGSFVVNFPHLVWVEAGTLRQAFVAFGNALKRVKKEELDKIWES